MSEKSILERTYFDKCNIYRKEHIEENSITKLRRRIIYENIPCALSKGRLGPPTKRDNFNENRQEHLLFIAPEIEILAGDEIEVILGVNGKGKKETFWAGAPFVYPSHQEVPLAKDERV